MMDQSSENATHGRVGYGRLAAKLTPALLALLMVAAVAIIALTNRDEDNLAREAIGKQAPAISLIDFETGNETSLSSLHGNVVVLNFWASWCTPCKNEMPAFQAVASDGAQDVRIIGVNIKNDRREDAVAFLEETGISYDVVVDSGGTDQRYGPIEQALGIGGSYPVTVFIRPSGEIDAIRIGELEEAQIREAIAEART
jgi:thiol-disulfide isomerase/thioredoxin